MKAVSTGNRRLAKLLSGLALGAACWLVGGACGSDEAHDTDTLTIGVLLPFTGPTAGTASNFERAVLLVVDRVNEGGGVQGKKLRVVSRDTHSDPARSNRSVEQLLEEGAQVVLGPESAELAQQILPTLQQKNVVFLSPLVGSAGDAQLDCAHPWFRLAPSANALGESLAKLVAREGSKKVAIVYSSGAYDEALQKAFDSRFEELSGTRPLDVRVDANAQTHAASVRAIVDADVDSIVLATSPRTAALAINEFEAAGLTERRLFLSPLLKTGLFVQNVAPAAVEGALGVAPGIFDDSAAFHDAFAERWRGDAPLEGAYFYYDATALVALALEKMGQAQASPDYTLVQALLEAAGPPGEAVQWDEVTLGLSRTRDGRDVYYAGLTGPMLLDKCGARKLGKSTTWTIHNGLIQNEAEE
jgi:ABC-type branched-subunit amino acid transport system substrate-binding protein